MNIASEAGSATGGTSYELTIALKPDLPSERAKEIVEDLKGMVKEVGGTAEKVESLGIKTLSYPIKGLTQASFTRLSLKISPEGSAKFQHELGRKEDLLRVLIIKGGESNG